MSTWSCCYRTLCLLKTISMRSYCCIDCCIITSALLRLTASPMLLHPLYSKGQDNPHAHHQPISQHALYNRMSPGSCFGLPLWPLKLGVDLLKVLLLSAVEYSAGLTQQLWLGHVQPQPVGEDLERKVGVPHGLTITINLQEKKKKSGCPSWALHHD